MRTIKRRPRLAAAAFLLGFLSALAAAPRLLFVRDTPINWDAVQFELALFHFDLAAHQPHPPGYILYVLAGRALNLVVGQPGVALSLLSVLAAGAAVPLLYRLALRIFEDPGIALGAALLLLASPLALYYGSVGLTYAPEMLSSIVVGGLAWRARSSPAPAPALVVALGIALGLAGGLRQTSIVVLLPVCLWALWGTAAGSDRPEAARRFGLFGLSLAVTCALWLVPLLALSGGPAAYLHQSGLLASAASARTSIFGAGAEGVGYNVAFEVLALGVGLAFGALPLGLWTLRVVRFSLARDVKAFVAFWALPAPVLYAFSHIGQYGYLLIVLPPLVLLSAVCARVLVERVARLRLGVRPLAGALVCATLALGSAAYFALAQGPTTAANIIENDSHWKAIRATLNTEDPASTALLMSNDWDKSFRMAGYLLPEFHSYSAGKGAGDAFGWLYSAYGGRSTYGLPHPPAWSYLDLPPGTRKVIALDTDIAEKFGEGQKPRQVPLSDGSMVYILQSNGPDIAALVLSGDRLWAVYREAAVK
jgi:hypothetical protein